MSCALIKGKSVNKHCEPTIDIEDDDPQANLIDLVERPEESTTAYLTNLAVTELTELSDNSDTDSEVFASESAGYCQ